MEHAEHAEHERLLPTVKKSFLLHHLCQPTTMAFATILRSCDKTFERGVGVQGDGFCALWLLFFVPTRSTPRSSTHLLLGHGGI